MLADAGRQAGLAPVGLEIPSIGMRTEVVPISRRPEGTLDMPATDASAAWYRESATPGEAGPAVMVGLYRQLRLLRPGDEIVVQRADGSEVRFHVSGIGVYPRKAFPNERMYGARNRSSLTLIASSAAGISDLVVTCV